MREEDRISRGMLLLSWEKLQNQVFEFEQSLFELKLSRCSHCMLCCPIFALFLADVWVCF